MSHGDNPAGRYNHHVARERDREHPIGDMPEALKGVGVDDRATRKGDLERLDTAVHREGRRRNLLDNDDDRTGAGGAPDGGPGAAGGTLGTDGTKRG